MKFRKKNKKQSEPSPDERIDGLYNELTKLGGELDPSMHNRVYRRGPVGEPEARAYWEDEHYMASAFSSLPDSAMSQGFTVSIDGETEEIMRLLEEYGVPLLLNQCDIASRVFGGAAIVMQVEDGRDSSQPIDLDNVSSITFLGVYTRWDFSERGELQGDASQVFWPEGYGRPQWRYIYRGDGQKVHASRLIELRGIEPINIDAFEANDWWGHSLAKRLKGPHDNLSMNDKSIAILVQKFFKPIYTMKNLKQLASANQAAKVIKDIFSSMVAADSMLGITLIDAEDEFKRETMTVNGIDTLHDRSIQAFSAAAQTPVTKLMGTTTGGFSSADDAGVENWNDRVTNHIKRKYIEKLRYMVELIMLANGLEGNVSIVVNPVNNPTEKEQAESFNVRNTALATAYDRGIISRDEYRNNINGFAGVQLDESDKGPDMPFGNSEPPDDLDLEQSILIEDAESFKPNQAMQKAAGRGLELRKANNGKGGTAVGVARARDLKSGKNLSLETVKRMASFFARHEGNQKAKSNEPLEKDEGYIAWLLWGGDAGKKWSQSIVERANKVKDRLDSMDYLTWSETPDGIKRYADLYGWGPKEKAMFVDVYNLEYDRLRMLKDESASTKSISKALKAVRK